MRNTMEQEVYRCILNFIDKGALVSGDGHYLSPENDMDRIRALFEDQRYMPDFVDNDEGHVIEIKFDKIS